MITLAAASSCTAAALLAGGKNSPTNTIKYGKYNEIWGGTSSLVIHKSYLLKKREKTLTKTENLLSQGY